MNIDAIVVGCFAVVLLEAPVIGAAFWFYKSRHKPMIKCREPTVSLIFAALMAFNFAFLILVRVTYGLPREGDCFWEETVRKFCIAGRAAAISIRSYLLWFQNRTQRERHRLAIGMAIVAQDKDDKDDSTLTIQHPRRPRCPCCMSREFFISNQQLTRWPYLVGICCWFFLWVFFFRFVETITCGGVPEPSGMGTVGLITSIIFFTSIFGIKEAFMIKFELVLLFICVVIHAITQYVDTPLAGSFLVRDAVFLVQQYVMLFVLLGFPLLLQRHVERSSNAVKTPRLETFLRNMKARECFREYLLMEFSVENLYFYEACGYYKKRPTVLRAIRLYTTFVSSNAKTQVNLSFGTVSDVQTALGHFYPAISGEGQDIVISHELEHELESKNLSLTDEETQLLSEAFDEPLTEIINLMEGDTFPRFLCRGGDKNYMPKKSSSKLLTTSV